MTCQITTPDEARELLDGTTPGEEWYYRVRWGRVHTLHPIGIDRTFGLLKVTEPDAALIAAASKMAHTLAGMRTEYAIEHQHIPGGQWHQVTGWSHESPLHDGHTLAPDERIIHRYVTEAMES